MAPTGNTDFDFLASLASLVLLTPSYQEGTGGRAIRVRKLKICGMKRPPKGGRGTKKRWCQESQARSLGVKFIVWTELDFESTSRRLSSALAWHWNNQ